MSVSPTKSRRSNASGKRRSATFEQFAAVQTDTSDVTDSPETWPMSEKVLAHLFAQVEHVQARMTASTPMSEVSRLVGERSLSLNFQLALGCAVMVEWCYLRQMSFESDSSDMDEETRSRHIDYYAEIGRVWDEKYEACKKFYNAPIHVLTSALDAIYTKATAID